MYLFRIYHNILQHTKIVLVYFHKCKNENTVMSSGQHLT